MTDKTSVAVLIGNSDDKLSQLNWIGFKMDTAKAIMAYSKQIHFSGESHSDAEWQNHCWVFEIRFDDIPGLKEELALVAKDNKQDSIAWVEGQTEFIKP